MEEEIKYEMVVYWSDEDGAYVVEVPELPGCMADGNTYEEAIDNTLSDKRVDGNRKGNRKGDTKAKRQVDLCLDLLIYNRRYNKTN